MSSDRLRPAKIAQLASIAACQLILTFFTPAAFADAPTHRLKLSAETLTKTDCGSDGCVPACQVQGALTNLKDSSSAPLTVILWYPTDQIDAGEAAVALDFPKLPGGRHRSIKNEIPGLACHDVRIKRVEVVCPGEQDERCPGFYNIEISDYPSFGLKKQKVEGK